MMVRSIHMDERLRSQHLLARKALEAAGHPDFKTLGSAKWVDISRSWKGCVLVQIEHDTMKGVEPEMVCWWFRNQARSTTWNGRDFTGPEIPLYHLWHHRDHVAITPLTNGPDGTVSHGFLEGADTRIEERFNETHFHVHTRMRTLVLNDNEFTFNIMFCGIPFGHITHLYAKEEGGCSFYAETEMGCKVPVIGWLINWLVMPFVYNKRTAEHWVRHNIEETGRTEDFLPVIYENRWRYEDA